MICSLLHVTDEYRWTESETDAPQPQEQTQTALLFMVVLRGLALFQASMSSPRQCHLAISPSTTCPDAEEKVCS